MVFALAGDSTTTSVLPFTLVTGASSSPSSSSGSAAFLAFLLFFTVAAALAETSASASTVAVFFFGAAFFLVAMVFGAASNCRHSLFLPGLFEPTGGGNISPAAADTSLFAPAPQVSGAPGWPSSPREGPARLHEQASARPVISRA